MVKQLTFNLQNGDRYPGLRPKSERSNFMENIYKPTEEELKKLGNMLSADQLSLLLAQGLLTKEEFFKAVLNFRN